MEDVFAHLFVLILFSFIDLPHSLTNKMADLEAVLADVSYLMAMEKSKCTPAARASKKLVLPDPRQVADTATTN